MSDGNYYPEVFSEKLIRIVLLRNIRNFSFEGLEVSPEI